ncbi:non-homologous end joining protein Ku-like [Macaca thibetana thibetana]|uniref:non-homologous end joining protein Ku-like n=1 Tax=Macaca thibetana thibetana TaxID=257877 RepID=UPI0021BCBD76|nr:non-homologous end joining protein Ku-like [Macaca thibetana thibetana]
MGVHIGEPSIEGGPHSGAPIEEPTGQLPACGSGGPSGGGCSVSLYEAAGGGFGQKLLFCRVAGMAEVPPVPGWTGLEVPPVPGCTGLEVSPVPGWSGLEVPPVPGWSGLEVPPVPGCTGLEVPPVPGWSRLEVPPVPGWTGLEAPSSLCLLCSFFFLIT